MQTPECITIIPTDQQEVIELLNSEALAAVEKPLATALKAEIIYDNSTASLSLIRGEISVCGLTTGQLENHLLEQRDSVIRFATRLLQDEEANEDAEEYPEDEEPDPDDDDEDEELGCANGFGITMAIYHNFLANRTTKDLRAYLKNRKIPQHTKFAKQLEEIFAETCE